MCVSSTNLHQSILLEMDIEFDGEKKVVVKLERERERESYFKIVLVVAIGTWNFHSIYSL